MKIHLLHTEVIRTELRGCLYSLKGIAAGPMVGVKDCCPLQELITANADYPSGLTWASLGSRVTGQGVDIKSCGKDFI